MTAYAGRIRPKALLCLAATLLATSAAAGEVWPRAVAPSNPEPVIKARVHSIVAGMTLQQKIGQMTQADIRSITPEDVRRYYIGSILNGGGAWPSMNMHSSVEDWLKLSDAFYRASMSRCRSSGEPTRFTGTTTFLARRSSRTTSASAQLMTRSF
jgi:beta-glucosidase